MDMKICERNHILEKHSSLSRKITYEHALIINTNNSKESPLLFSNSSDLSFDHLPDWFADMNERSLLYFYSVDFDSNCKNIFLESLALEINYLIRRFSDRCLGLDGNI